MTYMVSNITYLIAPPKLTIGVEKPKKFLQKCQKTC